MDQWREARKIWKKENGGIINIKGIWTLYQFEKKEMLDIGRGRIYKKREWELFWIMK